MHSHTLCAQVSPHSLPMNHSCHIIHDRHLPYSIFFFRHQHKEYHTCLRIRTAVIMQPDFYFSLYSPTVLTNVNWAIKPLQKILMRLLVNLLQMLRNTILPSFWSITLTWESPSFSFSTLTPTKIHLVI